MATSLPTPTPAGSSSDRPLRVRLPFISTSFATDLWYFALLWPVWWALGIDQLLLPFFVLYEFIRFLFRNHWQVRLNVTILLALGLAIWWVVPVFWIDPELLDIFLKETASIWTQFLFLVLFWNSVRTAAEWRRVAGALTLVAFYTVATSAIFLSGAWRGVLISLVGRVLPSSMIAGSAFFTSISYRTFGALASTEGMGLLSIRLNALTLSFSALSMLCLLLVPFIYWRIQHTRGIRRLFYLGILLGLLLTLVFTESRIAYAALLAGAAFYVLLRFFQHRPNRPLMFAIALIGAAVVLLLAFVVLGVVIDWFQRAFVDLRPGSWLVRIYIYRQTLALLPEHPIAGWGTSVRLPDLPNEYAAGTHSSYLGMLFQHGIIGLLLYLSLWASVWWSVWRGLNRRGLTREMVMFWMAIATAFLTFNIREVADSWWWDHSLMYVVWLLWGLALTGPQIFRGDASVEKP
ncbi:O-antigen ligase family protein [Promineifilum sp.]|uniref:O-antigen ligase family protein n=1 Tax=Promineifilum sp. TaxID=2664178 RepID=UPI0035B0133C